MSEASTELIACVRACLKRDDEIIRELRAAGLEPPEDDRSPRPSG